MRERGSFGRFKVLPIYFCSSPATITTPGPKTKIKDQFLLQAITSPCTFLKPVSEGGGKELHWGDSEEAFQVPLWSNVLVLVKCLFVFSQKEVIKPASKGNLFLIDWWPQLNSLRPLSLKHGIPHLSVSQGQCHLEKMTGSWQEV